MEWSAEDVAKEIQSLSFSIFEKTFVRQNPLFRYRKQKEEEAVPTKESISKEGQEFDFTPFEKKFPILLLLS